MNLRLATRSASLCLSHPSAGITDTHHCVSTVCFGLAREPTLKQNQQRKTNKPLPPTKIESSYQDILQQLQKYAYIQENVFIFTEQGT